MSAFKELLFGQNANVFGKPAPSMVLEGHSDIVMSCAISADGSIGLSCSHDNTCIVWDLETGQKAHILRGHTGIVHCCEISANGSIGISQSEDGTLIVWDTKEGVMLRKFKGLSQCFVKCALHLDGGSALATRSNDCLVLDVKSGTTKFNLKGHDKLVTFCAMSMDGKVAMTTSLDTTGLVWDLEQNKGEIRHVLKHHCAVGMCAMSPDAEIGVTGTTNSGHYTFSVWNLVSGGKMHNALVGHRSVVETCFFVPSAKDSIAVTGSLDSTCIFWNLDEGKKLFSLRASTKGRGCLACRFQSCATSADGSTVIAASQDTTCKLWKIHSHKQVLHVLERDLSHVLSVLFPEILDACDCMEM
mmetsp:Transcript_26313/g.36681  ORF Transcript_26313/g.36681 Transcript_26313/m.36681 type:complete len:358 (+) Transcript_26313:271-1344(+)|eukprot:CAMPEP_0184490818 /NCGR_PEP_ID=MMETSP0113_2-20130426/18939_1 /TAXON_ID=91329 /ORGANISM="Norrisiella sphaerica, Strain BC52" /LENGTH=357 /DNA_ID=CAMNT_0026874915 /DNA_START=269 /DNA_END=1342 /DNA_ORIENTATION=+